MNLLDDIRLRLAVECALLIAGLLLLVLPLPALGSALGVLLVLSAFAVVAFARVRYVRRIHQLSAALEAPGSSDHARWPGGAFRAPDLRLAEGIRRTTERWRETTRRLEERSSQLEAVMDAMHEGVMVLDADLTLLRLNGAVGRLLGVEMSNPVGKSLPEAIRRPEIRRLVEETLETGSVVEREITLVNEEEQFLLLRGAPMGGPLPGRVLVVMSDVTRLRRLERVRRDFVANVSHELKTPLFVLQGGIETLRGGAPDPAESGRFLDMMARQTDRLGALVEDLLALSRIESEEERPSLEKSEVDARALVEEAIRERLPLAEAKSIRLRLEAPEGLRIVANGPLLIQATANLIANAVHCSESGTEVVVRVEGDAAEVRISVHDHGIGIEARHLPRLFERFYRVDPSRSRKLGGTGLGLAIVKHIAQLHGGRVSVQSRIREGSVFTLHLPAAPR